MKKIRWLGREVRLPGGQDSLPHLKLVVVANPTPSFLLPLTASSISFVLR